MEHEEVKPSKKLSLGVEELQAIVATAVKAAQEESASQTAKAFDKLAEALLESRRPYVDPKQAENDKRFKESMQATIQRQREQRERDRENCPHVQGSNPLSEFQGQMTSFAIHQSDTGEMVGICTNCGKLISSLVQEDRQWFMKKSANRISRAGQRVFANPLEVQKAGAEGRI